MYLQVHKEEIIVVFLKISSWIPFKFLPYCFVLFKKVFNLSPFPFPTGTGTLFSLQCKQPSLEHSTEESFQ